MQLLGRLSALARSSFFPLTSSKSNDKPTLKLSGREAFFALLLTRGWDYTVVQAGPQREMHLEALLYLEEVHSQRRRFLSCKTTTRRHGHKTSLPVLLELRHR